MSFIGAVSIPEGGTRIHLRPATRVVVTGTGFSSHEREVLKEWVLQLGVQYSGDLVCRFSTHLVCKDLLAAFNGAKYVKALHWGITIVSFRWIYDSLRAGGLLPATGYKSDTPGPADLALREAVSLRIKLEALQEASRAPLRELSKNSHHTGKSEDGKVMDLRDQTENHKKRPAGRESDAAANDFTFDIPSGRSAPDSSPRLCQLDSMAQPLQQPAHEEDSPVTPHFMVMTIEPQGAAEGGPQQEAAELCPTTEQVVSPLSRKQPQPPTQMPTPSTIELSFSELHNVDVTITVAAEENVGGDQPDGEGTETPTSRVNYIDANVTPCNATTTQPAWLGMGTPASPTEPRSPGVAVIVVGGGGGGGGELGSGILAGSGGIYCRQAAAEDEDEDLSTPACGTSVAPAAPAYGHMDGAGTLDTTLDSNDIGNCNPEQCKTAVIRASSVLYSGFEVPLAAVATASKGRRLRRNDGLIVAVEGYTPRKGIEDEELFSYAHLEDDLEDDIDYVPPHKATSQALDGNGEKVTVDCRRGVPPFASASFPRPPLVASVKNLMAGIDSKGNESGRFLSKPMPAAATAEASSRASEGGGSLAHIHKRLQQQQQQRGVHLQQDVKPEYLPGRRSAEQTLSIVGATIHIKNEPGFGADQTGPVGPVRPQAQVQDQGELTSVFCKGGAVPQLSARRHAAALATSSLVSEPEPMAPRPGPVSKKSGRGPSQAFLHTGTDLDEMADGCDGSSSSHNTPSGLHDLDISTVSSPDFDSGARPDNRGELPPQRLTLEDCATLGEAQPGGSGRGKKVGGETGADPGPKSVKRSVSRREDDFVGQETLTSAARGVRRSGSGQARNAATMKSLPRADGKGSRRNTKETNPDNPMTTQIDGDTSNAGADDQDFCADGYDGPGYPMTNKSRSSLASSYSASLLQSTPQQLGAGSNLNQWPREPLTNDKSISEHLQISVQLAEEYLTKEWPTTTGGLLSDSQVHVMKAMRRPKVHTLAQRHPHVTLKMVQFAEQIMLEPLNLVLNCRDKTKRARCALVTLTNDSDTTDASMGREIFLAEPCNLYRLPAGEWWMEYYRYFTITDVTTMATAAGRSVSVPNDFDSMRELMRDAETSHCRVIDVRGNISITRTKKANPPLERGRAVGSGRPAFCRFTFDRHICAPVFIQQAADYVID